MRALFSSATVCIVFGLLAISGASAYGQEGTVTWNSALNNFGSPVVRTNRELVPKERIEIEVVKGVRGLKVGIGRTDGSPLARIWQPNEAVQGKTLSFTMSATTQVGLAVSEGDGPYEQASVKNTKDSTVLSYGSEAVVLRVKVIRPGVQPAGPSTGPAPSPEDDKPAPPRWEVVVGTDGKPSIRTKELANSLKMTIKAARVVYTRYVSVGVYVENTKTDYFDLAKPIQAASDKPIEKQFAPGPNYLKGLIQIGIDPSKPDKPKTVESFKGYDKLVLDDGTVFIVKIAK
jgi:hypothetical protein